MVESLKAKACDQCKLSEIVTPEHNFFIPNILLPPPPWSPLKHKSMGKEPSQTSSQESNAGSLSFTVPASHSFPWAASPVRWVCSQFLQWIDLKAGKACHETNLLKYRLSGMPKLHNKCFGISISWTRLSLLQCYYHSILFSQCLQKMKHLLFLAVDFERRCSFSALPWTCFVIWRTSPIWIAVSSPPCATLFWVPVVLLCMAKPNLGHTRVFHIPLI